MTDTLTSLTGWAVCNTPGCPLEDSNTPADDDMTGTAVAHGVEHINMSDHWWTRTDAAPGLADNNRLVLAAAAWLVREDGRDDCIGTTDPHWLGSQLRASDLLRAIDQAATQ
ncbi:hypothetical protein ACH4T9_12940 [Micromonospora sp. NPDC020750]|uniref:hypothetical protein n=1 Tax=unclassified Micromonospora TaxID=2617518 RepID=UPI00379F9525